MPSTREAEPKGSGDSSPLDETIVMPVVVPLAEKPKHDPCLHLAYEVTGKRHIPGDGPSHHTEWRKCSDCGHRWDEQVEGPLEPEPKEEAPQGPPPVAYAHAQIVTYQVGDKQFQVLVEETAMVSVQNGVIQLEHPEGPIAGIVAVRPWLREVTDGAYAAH